MALSFMRKFCIQACCFSAFDIKDMADGILPRNAKANVTILLDNSESEGKFEALGSGIQ